MDKFIQKYGTAVDVSTYFPAVTVSSTKAVLGRNAKSQQSTDLLENLKEGIFPFGFDIDSGYVVHSPEYGESFIVSGVHKDINRRTQSKVAALLQCNSTMNVKSKGTVADKRGNIKESFVDVFSGVPCYLKQVKNELIQADAGQHVETDYLVYTTSLPIKETDQITIVVRGQEEPFKVVAKDYLTYPNMVVLSVCRDVRK